MSKTRLNLRFSWILFAVGFLFPAIASSADLSPREVFVFESICLNCHARPEIGVPLIGDEVEWERRRLGGFEQLMTHTVEGYLGMPPLGGCSFCSEEELRNLISILSNMPIDPAQ
jgi:cytochrome c5